MTAVRYFVLALLTCAPTLALAQAPTDSVVILAGDIVAPGRTAQFGAQFTEGELVGPLPLSIAEPLLACAETGPLTNADEVEGTIVLISRGECAFTEKMQAASEAGAVAAVVYNPNPDALCGGTPCGPDGIISMSGDCTVGEGCSIPGAFVSYDSGQDLLAEADLGTEAVIDPVRIYDLPCGFPGYFGTNRVSTFLFTDGFVGTSPRVDDPNCFWNFDFEGDDGLGIASVLVGQEDQGEAIVTGSPYVDVPEYEIGWQQSVFLPFAPPFEDFDRGEVNVFSSPLGLEIAERAFARDEDAFIVLDLHVTNVTDEELSGIHVGLFADWDVGDAQQNLGGFDEGTNLLYVYDDSGASTNYFGVAALGVADVAGWTLATEGAASDASLFEGMTTEGLTLEQPQDARTVIGIGPFDLAPGDSADVRLAMVAGESREDIIASAQAAQQAVFVDNEAAPPEQALSLGPVYPNPTAIDATISLDLPTAQAVRVAVFDVLGREVAVLTDGVRPAGAQTLALDAAALPSGTYFVRVEAGGMRRVRPFTVVR